MFFDIEISRPFQWKPYFTHTEGITIFSFCWLWFRIGLHPMRYDEMLKLAMTNQIIWKE
jgi:hypothetical protein